MSRYFGMKKDVELLVVGKPITTNFIINMYYYQLFSKKMCFFNNYKKMNTWKVIVWMESNN